MASMLLSRVCPISVKLISRTIPQLRPSIFQVPRNQIIRKFSEEGKDVFKARTARRRGIKEMAMEPTSGAPFAFGQGALAMGGLFGLGMLCFFGLGMANEKGALEKSHLWPQYVRDRIKTTYMYFGSSIGITAASAMAAFQVPMIMRIVTRNGFLGIAISMAAILGTGILAQSIEYKPGFGPKQMAWMLHCGVMGAMLAPICYMGGPILIKAAWLTCGVVGGLSAVAVCAPSEQFLMLGGPLAIGLGVVIASSFGSMFLAPSTALGAGLHSINLYGGLLLFSGFLLYDTQRIILQAERYPTFGVRPYDPINASISIYLDTLNIFIRIATILAGGGQGGDRRRK